MWSHRRQPTRLHHPWDSPGKSIGVGCHCLLHPGGLVARIPGFQCSGLGPIPDQRRFHKLHGAAKKKEKKIRNERLLYFTSPRLWLSSPGTPPLICTPSSRPNSNARALANSFYKVISVSLVPKVLHVPSFACTPTLFQDKWLKVPQIMPPWLLYIHTAHHSELPSHSWA